MVKPRTKADKSRCPICGMLVKPKGAHYPFCSERCRLVDLGKWLKEDYTVSRPAEEEDIEEDS